MATISTADLAAALETTPRTLRKFLRSDASGIDSVGKGSRYAIEKREVRSLKGRFAKWETELAAKRTAPEDAPEELEETAPEATDEN